MITATDANGNPSSVEISTNSKFSFLLSLILKRYYIFPLHDIVIGSDGTPRCACGGYSGCTGPGKHPAVRWSCPWDPYNKRTEARLAAFVQKWPNRGWGIHLGLSGLVCFDIDNKPGWEQSLEALRQQHGIGRAIPHVVTGGGGLHFYFLAPANCDPRSGWTGPNGATRCQTTPLPRVDFCAGQHYMVLPFSPHKSGQTYVASGGWDLQQITPSLVALVDRQSAFVPTPRPAQVERPALVTRQEPAGTPSVSAARAYVLTMAPAISGRGGSRAAGRVARVLCWDFALDRFDARMLFNEYNARCEPPWTAAEIERKLDYGESGTGTRGWRNGTRGGGLTADEEEFMQKMDWTLVSFKSRTLGKNGDPEAAWPAAELVDLADVVRACEFMSPFVALLPTAEPEAAPAQSPLVRCPFPFHVLMAHLRESRGRYMSFPCRRMRCPFCFERFKSVWKNTMDLHIYRWWLKNRKQSSGPLFAAEVPAERWSKVRARLRKRNASYFAVRLYPMGSGSYRSLFVLSTQWVSGCAWREMGCDDGRTALPALIDALPSDLEERPWSSSRDWGIPKDPSPPVPEWRKIGRTKTSDADAREIVGWHNCETKPIYARSGLFPWNGFEFSFDPSQRAAIFDDLDAGVILAGNMTFRASRPQQDALDTRTPDEVFNSS